MKRVGDNQWPLMFDASLDGGRTSEKWLFYERLRVSHKPVLQKY